MTSAYGLLAPALTTPRQGGNPAPSLLTSLDNAKRRQSAAAGCGGKVPLPGAHANAPTGGVRHLALASRGWSAKK